jgi:hypothetical protein
MEVSMVATKRETIEAPHQRAGIMTCEFDQINSAGVYVENRTGSLMRIPEDALIPGRSPAIEILSTDPWVVTKISSDPYLPLTKARLIAADLDLVVHF